MPTEDQQLANEVEAALAGKTARRQCVICQKAMTTKRCHLCDGAALCQNCRVDHMARHFDIHDVPCVECGKATPLRCQGCSRPVCGYYWTTKTGPQRPDCEYIHRKKREHCKKSAVKKKRLNRPRLDIAA